MFRKIGSIFFLLLFVTTSSALAQLKIGYMNSQEVLSQMPERQNVEQQLNTFIKQKRQELQQRTTSFQDSVAQFRENQASMSQAQAQQREQELSKMQQSIRQFQQNLQQQIQQRRSKLLQPLYDRMNEAISTVAENNDLDFVLNEATSTGENIVYYSSSERMDITEEVLQQITATSAQN